MFVGIRFMTGSTAVRSCASSCRRVAVTAGPVAGAGDADAGTTWSESYLGLEARMLYSWYKR